MMWQIVATVMLVVFLGATAFLFATRWRRLFDRP